MGFKPRASAFLVTKRVWGMGPSCASISSTTPSTMDKARSTSPPKSACPGVSTMLMCVPSQLTAQFLARIVMPRSFSMALLSITVSTTFSWLGKGAGLAQQLIDHGGFAVVNVGDDGDVAYLFSSHGSLSLESVVPNARGVQAVSWFPTCWV
jgi:hypothetical protein